MHHARAVGALLAAASAAVGNTDPLGGFYIEFVVVVAVDVYFQQGGGFRQGSVVHPRGGGAAGMEQQAHSEKNQQGFDCCNFVHYLVVHLVVHLVVAHYLVVAHHLIVVHHLIVAHYLVVHLVVAHYHVYFVVILFVILPLKIRI